MRRKKKQEVFEKVKVVDAGAKGKTIGKAPDGRVVFLSNAVPGDLVDVQTSKRRKAYYEGKAINFHQLSSKRTKASCSHFGICGGCKWQNMAYEHQLFYKQQEVENNLKRIGHLELPKIEPIIGADAIYFYRNKMEFSFSNKRWLTKDELMSEDRITNKNALGLHIPGMWDKVLDLDTCYLQRDPSNTIRKAIKNFAEENSFSFFDPRNQSGLLRNLIIRTASTGDLMVVLQFYHDDSAKRSQILNHLQEEFPEITSLQYIINQKKNDSFYDQEVICYFGKDHIVEEMEGLRFKISPKSFYQTNSEQAYALYKVVREFAGLSGKETVYDLYSGTGTIAQFLAKDAKKVIGIEGVPEAVADAKANALENGLTNVSFYAGDMKDVFIKEFIEEHGAPEVLVSDPPREGMHADVVAQIAQLGAGKVVYVSCNSATQARDLAILSEHYQVTKVQPVDMFPQTHHVENVVLLKKINS